MSNDCKTGPDGLCEQCGAPVEAWQSRYCQAGPKAAKQCAWLGQPTDKFGLLKCNGCCGNVQLKIVAHDCALYGLCLPKSRGDASLYQCRTCHSNTARSAKRDAVKPTEQQPDREHRNADRA